MRQIIVMDKHRQTLESNQYTLFPSERDYNKYSCIKLFEIQTNSWSTFIYTSIKNDIERQIGTSVLKF